LAEFVFIVADGAEISPSSRLRAFKPARMLTVIQTSIYLTLHTLEINRPQVVRRPVVPRGLGHWCTARL